MTNDPLFTLEGRVAHLTGCTGEMGHAIAGVFLQRGARVHICSRRAEAGEADATELSAVGDCRGLVGDPSSVAGTVAIATALVEREAALGIVVHNAGLSTYAAFESFTEAEWDDVFDINLKGVFFLNKMLHPLLRAAASAATSARIISIGSSAGVRASPNKVYSYSVSKAALNCLTLAWRFAGEQITLNTVSPGTMRPV